MYSLPEEQENLIHLLINTPEGEDIWDKLEKIDKVCSNWIHASIWIKLKKELFLQWMDSLDRVNHD